MIQSWVPSSLFLCHGYFVLMMMPMTNDRQTPAPVVAWHLAFTSASLHIDNKGQQSDLNIEQLLLTPPLLASFC